MLACHEVLVASSATPLLEDLVEALREEGVLIVAVEEASAGVDILTAGFRPDAVVVDGAMRGAAHLVACVRRAWPPRIPVVAASPATPSVEAVPDLVLAKRNVGDVVATLDRVCGP